MQRSAVIRKRGRPTKDEVASRRNFLLDRALEQFLTVGYRATTMDSLASAFGASKATFYRLYGSKASLLRAAMERGVPEVRGPLAAVDRGEGRPVAAVLHDFAGVILDYHRDPRTHALWRAVSEARVEMPELVDEILVQQTAALAPVSDYLAALDQAGLIRLDNSQAGAVAFSQMVSGGLAGFLLGPDRHPSGAGSAQFAVDLFLNGILPRDGSGQSGRSPSRM